MPARLFGREKSALLAVVPAGAKDAVHVQVAALSSNGLPFELLERADPTLNRIDPSAAAPGHFIEILGSNLYDLSPPAGKGHGHAFPFHFPTVTFGGKRALFVLPTVEGLHVLVPFHAESGDVQVKVGEVTSNTLPFTVR